MTYIFLKFILINITSRDSDNDKIINLLITIIGSGLLTAVYFFKRRLNKDLLGKQVIPSS